MPIKVARDTTGGEAATLDFTYYSKSLPQGLTDNFDTLVIKRSWLPLSITWGGPGMIVTTLREDAKTQLNTALPGEKVTID